MNKSLVSIAVLAFAGAASAQSSVSLYGRIDASLASQKTEVGGVTTVDNGPQIRSGAHTGSRFGLKGTEDLGGGLKANFQLEQGFNVDDGTPSSARQFHRQAWVGLSGGFGSLQLGRQYSTIYNLYSEHDVLVYSGYSAMVYAFNSGAYADSSRIDNAAGHAYRGRWAHYYIHCGSFIFHNVEGDGPFIITYLMWSACRRCMPMVR